MSNTYEDLLNQFADHVGLDAKELASTEEVLIDGIAVGLQLDGDPIEGDLVFFTMLGIPSADHLNRIAPTLLQANNFWVGTGGCTLGLQQGTGTVTLCGRLALSALTGESVAMVLDGFVNTASFWKGFVEGKPEPADVNLSSMAQFNMRA